jgi:hypothetical protein
MAASSKWSRLDKPIRKNFRSDISFQGNYFVTKLS